MIADIWHSPAPYSDPSHHNSIPNSNLDRNPVLTFTLKPSLNPPTEFYSCEDEPALLKDCSVAFAIIIPMKLVQKLTGLGLKKVCLQLVQWPTGRIWQHHILNTGPQKQRTHWDVSSALCCPCCSPMTVLPTWAQLRHYSEIWRWHDQPGPHQKQRDWRDNGDVTSCIYIITKIFLFVY